MMETLAAMNDSMIATGWSTFPFTPKMDFYAGEQAEQDSLKRFMKAAAWTKRSDEIWSNVFTLCARVSSVVHSAGFGFTPNGKPHEAN
jgi:hypothetical protein